MKLLLDTHIWIWSLMDPARLTRRVRAALGASGNELWLSPMSTWEFLILVEKGRIELDGKVDDWLAEARRRAPMHEAPITHEIARESRLVDLAHEDPVDRFLAATTRLLDLTLVTSDARLVRSRTCRTLANRPA